VVSMEKKNPVDHSHNNNNNNNKKQRKLQQFDLLVCKENKGIKKVNHVQVSCLDDVGPLKEEQSLQMLGLKFRACLCCATGRFASPWLWFQVVSFREKKTQQATTFVFPTKC